MIDKKKNDGAYIPFLVKNCLGVSNFIENIWKKNYQNRVRNNADNQNKKCEEKYSMMFEYIVCKIAQENNTSPDEVHEVLEEKMNIMISMADSDMVENLYEIFGNRKPTVEEFIIYLYETMHQYQNA